MKITDITDYQEMDREVENKSITGYMQSRFPHIRCNYSLENIDANNYGYCYGVTKDGIPFEAEMWYDHNPESTNVTIYLPEIEDFNEVEDEPLINQTTGTRTFSRDTQIHNNNMALDVGMVDNGQIESLSLLNTYVELLVDSEMISFPGNVYNAAGWRCTDIDGNCIVALNITLNEDDELMAMTSLKFTPFVQRATGKPKLQIVRSIPAIYHHIAENTWGINFDGRTLHDALSEKSLDYDEFHMVCDITMDFIDSGEWKGVADIQSIERYLELLIEQAVALMPLQIEDYDRINRLDKWQEENGDDDNERIDAAVNEMFLDDECRKMIEMETRRGRFLDLAEDIGISV